MRTWLAAVAALLALLPAHPSLAQPPSGDEVLEGLRGSPLSRGGLGEGELEARGLDRVELGDGLRLELERYVEATRLDRQPSVAPLFRGRIQRRHLAAPPSYRQTLELAEDRLVIDRVLEIELAPGTCRGSGERALPKAVSSLCFHETEPRAGKRGRLPEGLERGLEELRRRLEKAPADREVGEGVTAARARTMSDEELLDVLLNGPHRTIRLTSVIPLRAYPRRPRLDLRDFSTPLPAARELAPERGALSQVRPRGERRLRLAEPPAAAATPESGEPAESKAAGERRKELRTAKKGALKRIAPSQEPTLEPKPAEPDRDFPPRYSLTGFTLGREIEDTYELTFAKETWLTDRYYLRLSYRVSAGFGLRLPFSATVETESALRVLQEADEGSGVVPKRLVALSVQPENASSENGIYRRVGLPGDRHFGGEEFLLEISASCDFHASIPGPDLTGPDCPSIDEGMSRDFRPVLGGGRTEVSELWLDHEDSGLGFSAGIGSVGIDVGLSADMTDGEIRLQVSPGEGSELLNLPGGNGDLRFARSGAGPARFTVGPTGGERTFGFRLHRPRYRLRLELTPQIRATARLDLGVYELRRSLGPWAFDALSVGEDFELPLHEGTRAAYSYSL